MAIETSGFMHEQSIYLIKNLAHVAFTKNKRNVDYYDMERYMFTKISVALFNAIGTVVNRRINAANNHRAASLEEFQRNTEFLLEAVTPAQ